MSDYVGILKQIKEKMKTIELTVHVMFVKRIPFVTCKNWKFTTITNVVDQKAATLLKSLCSIKIIHTTKIFLYNIIYGQLISGVTRGFTRRGNQTQHYRSQ